MNKLVYLIICIQLLIIGCTSTVNTKVYENIPPTPQDENIEVFGLLDNVPPSYRPIGEVFIGDSGFSVDCGWENVLKLALDQCREKGGNAIKILEVREPDTTSTCYRLSAAILLGPKRTFIDSAIESTGYTENELIAEWSEKGVDRIEGIYERIGTSRDSNYKIAIKRNGIDEYIAIYINGVIGDYANKWTEGDLKATFLKTASSSLYKVIWYMADKSIERNVYATIQDEFIEITFPDFGDEDTYLKLYPNSNSVLASINPEIVGSGTGFALNDEGYIVTNYHVVKDANFISVLGFNGDFDNRVQARSVSFDRNNDIAILQIINASFNQYPVPYTFSEESAAVGESVFALGYPLRSSMGDEIKLTNGIISSRSGYQGDITNYQVSVPVQPGNSGGPLFNDRGEVVGIIVAKHTGAENASYAIKIPYLYTLLNSMDKEIVLSSNAGISSMRLSEKVAAVKPFVYIIETQ